MKLSQIKPDPNQPRRTFDAEKMAALEGSMRTHGFRDDYPIIVDENNVIVDGERRWRAAKTIGLKEVPVTVHKSPPEAERIWYQLQSEGVEIETDEKDEAYLRMYEVGQTSNPSKYTSLFWAKGLGITEATFASAIGRAKSLRKVVSVLPEIESTDAIGYNTKTEIGREKDRKRVKKMAKKAIEEEWDVKRTREIRRAIKENPLREKQILEQDYSGDFWDMTLEVAKSDVDIEEVKEMDNLREKMESQVDAYNRIISYGLRLAAAMKEFDYTSVTPQARATLHMKVQKFMPFATGYVKELEEYMMEQGELKSNKRMIKE